MRTDISPCSEYTVFYEKEKQKVRLTENNE